MPRRCATDPVLDASVIEQDWLVTREQALSGGLTRRAIDHRLANAQWRVLLPGVYLTHHRGDPSRRQMLIGAQLYAGPQAAIDGADACRFHGIKAIAINDSIVQVVVPWGEPVRSTRFVAVRRTTRPLTTSNGTLLRFVDAATAVIAATRLMTGDRSVLAALSDALQRDVATYEELVRAHNDGPPRNSRRTDRALKSLATGARSAPEADFLALVATSRILPTPLCNALLRLQNGRRVSPDALFPQAALVHETNGRVAHRRDDLFDDMQERHDMLTAAGFTVLHNSPRSLTRNGWTVIRQLEQCYQRDKGRGLPSGVEIITLAS